MQVSKYHGCGNDFIITKYEDIEEQKRVAFIIAVCDRHTGIGADGCIFVKENPLEMIYYNCDGSRAPMCGNGIRCFAKYCYDEGICKDTTYNVLTLAGVKQVHVDCFEPFIATIAMGKANYDLEHIHVREFASPLMGYPLCIDDMTFYLYSFYMSTVHTVIFVEDAFATEYERIGKLISQYPLFEEQTNVNFVELINELTIRMQTYERGVGMTLACGTGACAAALMAYKIKHTSSRMHVQLPKGMLEIQIDEQEQVYMSGPANRIAKGEYVYD